jgi:hypothetical protein
MLQMRRQNRRGRNASKRSGFQIVDESCAVHLVSCAPIQHIRAGAMSGNPPWSVGVLARFGCGVVIKLGDESIDEARAYRIAGVGPLA